MMKKTFAAGLVLAMLLSVPALAAGQTAIVPISATTQTSGYPIEVNGKPVEARAVVLVPVRAVGEALGFTVTWDKTIGGAKLDNGKVHTEVIPGRDLFVVTSSTAIGMTAPFSLGGAPVILSGSLYVPVGLFRPLLGNRADAVTVKDGVVSISATSETAVQIPNPITIHKTVAALEKAVGFTVPLPTAPTGYKAAQLRDIGGKLAEIRFENGADQLTYRVSQGKDDNSGNSTNYATATTLTVGGTSVQCLGEGKTVYLAKWTQGDFAFSLQSTSGLTGLEAMVKSIL